MRLLQENILNTPWLIRPKGTDTKFEISENNLPKCAGTKLLISKFYIAEILISTPYDQK